MNHLVDQQKEPELYAIRAKYGHMWDGFQALCSGSQVERNVMLAHYFTKMVKQLFVLYMLFMSGNNFNKMCLYKRAIG